MLVMERTVAPDDCLYDLCFEFFFVVSFFFTKLISLFFSIV